MSRRSSLVFLPYWSPRLQPRWAHPLRCVNKQFPPAAQPVSGGLTPRPLQGRGSFPRPGLTRCKWEGVCISFRVCVSLLLHHDGWILPLEICIFRMRVGFFPPSKCTHFVLNTVATTSYRHLSDAESISSVVGDTLSAAGPRGPGGFPAPWGPCHEGGDRALQGQMGGMCSCFGWVGSKLGVYVVKVGYADWWWHLRLALGEQGFDIGKLIRDWLGWNQWISLKTLP